ncbi:hypothetical protein KsCSTR_39210 [Candidatus Kuenenia stuttgartiensis]|uniref:Uncharacterized protein n=1 Tax=Kuenenia stuttgartiensis TaxID=174633 RepID=Q1PUL5_KUEST|nr:hypothetical protein KsCSTR_39210 [Candidatus Kuenenia stuttgartiensis]CAJ70925.1 unknown protein [Candidatus Kuenenia stuttgartiensis]
MYSNLWKMAIWPSLKAKPQQIKLFVSYLYVKFNFITCSPVASISALLYIAMKAEIWPLIR